MKKIFACIVIASALASACENKDTGNLCYRGRVAWYSCCTGSTFISIQSFAPLGKNTRINNKDYSNLIQVPGYVAGPEVYLKLRNYEPQKDMILFPIHCCCFVAEEAGVPIFVATSISNASCPGEHH